MTVISICIAAGVFISFFLVSSGVCVVRRQTQSRVRQPVSLFWQSCATVRFKHDDRPGISTDTAYLKHISPGGSIKIILESVKLPLSSFASAFQPYGDASIANILNAPKLGLVYLSVSPTSQGIHRSSSKWNLIKLCYLRGPLDQYITPTDAHQWNRNRPSCQHGEKSKFKPEMHQKKEKNQQKILFQDYT